MALLSSSSQRPLLSGPQAIKHTQFVAYAKVIPDLGFGRRVEMWRDLEKKAQMVEEDLQDAGFNLALPVAFSPQFQQVPARLTIYGFIANTNENVAPITPSATVIHSGTIEGEKTAILTPPQGDQNRDDKPTATTLTSVAELKNALELASPGLDIFYLSFNGVRFGQQPNRKGFLSFPTL